MIAPQETEIRGRWIAGGGKVEADQNCERIEDLTRNELRKIGQDQTGWDVLYVDPRDGRFWELTYPQSEFHGGGPPLLTQIAKSDAEKKYGTLPP
jgi:hypothetical protein